MILIFSSLTAFYDVRRAERDRMAAMENLVVKGTDTNFRERMEFEGRLCYCLKRRVCFPSQQRSILTDSPYYTVLPQSTKLCFGGEKDPTVIKLLGRIYRVDVGTTGNLECSLCNFHLVIVQLASLSLLMHCKCL